MFGGGLNVPSRLDRTTTCSCGRQPVRLNGSFATAPDWPAAHGSSSAAARSGGRPAPLPTRRCHRVGAGAGSDSYLLIHVRSSSRDLVDLGLRRLVTGLDEVDACAKFTPERRHPHRSTRLIRRWGDLGRPTLRVRPIGRRRRVGTSPRGSRLLNCFTGTSTARRPMFRQAAAAPPNRGKPGRARDQAAPPQSRAWPARDDGSPWWLAEEIDTSRGQVGRLITSPETVLSTPNSAGSRRAGHARMHVRSTSTNENRPATERDPAAPWRSEGPLHVACPARVHNWPMERRLAALDEDQPDEWEVLRASRCCCRRDRRDTRRRMNLRDS